VPYIIDQPLVGLVLTDYGQRRERREQNKLLHENPPPGSVRLVAYSRKPAFCAPAPMALHALLFRIRSPNAKIFLATIPGSVRNF
jgi:hypothetical protein